MRIKYFGENKEEGTERVAIIRFTDDEFDLYKYIENYEHTYGDVKRKFASGGLIGIERNEKGVWINESYISVDDFTDFNDFKANYKEAKKEFKTLKKLSTETEPETATETEPETATETEPETVTETEHETVTETESEMTTEIESAQETAEKTEIAVNMLKYGMSRSYRSDFMVKNLNLNNFLKALIKTIGLEKVTEVRYTSQGMNVFFEYHGEMYKCYTPQSKLYKLTGQRFNRITWRDLKKEATETDDNNDVIYTARSPPEPSLLNLSRKIN